MLTTNADVSYEMEVEITEWLMQFSATLFFLSFLYSVHWRKSSMGCAASMDAVNDVQPASNRAVSPRLPSLQKQREQISDLPAMTEMSSGESLD